MLLSVHIPKTAGTSFGITLIERYGRALMRDYDHRLFQEDTDLERKRDAMDDALKFRAEDFEGTAGVHGHFLAIKYSLVAQERPCEYVTWLRHPVSRMMSHYYYWQESYDPKYAGPIHRRCVQEKWSFEKFCLYEDFRNFQAQFLWGVPLASFSFVGITEHFDEDFVRFGQRYFGADLSPQRVNATKSKPDFASLDSGLRREIEQFHAIDMELYEGALSRRQRELQGLVAARAAVRSPEPTVASPSL